MSGLSRLFFGIVAAVLWLLSHVFLFPAERLRRASAWCHARSLAPSIGA